MCSKKQLKRFKNLIISFVKRKTSPSSREKQFARTKNPSLKEIKEAYKSHIPRPDVSGKKNGNYKHGMGEDYKRIRVKGKKIKISHIVWMLKNKQNYIPEGFIIHHINGNKRDDRLENLKLENEGKHMRENLKQWKEQRIKKNKK